MKVIEVWKLSPFDRKLTHFGSAAYGGPCGALKVKHLFATEINSIIGFGKRSVLIFAGVSLKPI